MFKKRMVGLALLLASLLFIIILSSMAYAKDLDCSYVNAPCAADETKVLGFSNYTNAHAEIPSQINYSWNVCCKVSTPTTVNVSCNGADTYLTGLNSSDGTGITNAHLEVPNQGGIPSASLACLSATPGTILCSDENLSNNYALYNKSCPSDKTCLFTQSNITNAHVGDCNGDTYGWQKCCKFYSNPCGKFGQPCCAGECDESLVCVGNVCIISEPHGYNSTIWGYVTNSSGTRLGNVKVEALSKNSSYTNVNGYYELKLGNLPQAGDSFDLVASAGSYEASILSNFPMQRGYSVQQDFTLTNYRGNCNDDCTTVGSNLCSASCHGKGTCFYSSPEVMNACDGTFGWTELPDGRFVNCCKGQPISPTKASSVSVPCASSLTKSQKIVLYLGKLVKMNILTFKC